MILIGFLIGLLIYCTQAHLGYMTTFKQSDYYIPVAVLTSVISGTVWFSIAKFLGSDHQKVMKYGFIWDGMIVLAYLLIPILFHGVRLETKGLMGICFIIAGTILLKI